MEVLSLTLSVVSLFVASVAAYLTYRLGRQQIHLMARHEYHKLLLDIDKELMRDPVLWGLWDDHDMAAHRPAEEPARAAQAAKIEAFAFMLLNLLEMVFAFEREAGSMTAEDRENFAGWHGTCRDCVFRSTVVRQLIDRDDAQLVFGSRYLAYLKRLKHEWEATQPARTNPAYTPAPVAPHA